MCKTVVPHDKMEFSPASMQDLFSIWKLVNSAPHIERKASEIAKNDLELLILLIRLPNCWGYKYVLPCSGYVILEIKPRTSCM